MVLKHHKILKEIIKEKKKDPRVVSILLFGSLAKGTAHSKSDIDIEIIYKRGKWKETQEHIGGIKIDYEYWPKKKLMTKLNSKPYLCYQYLSERILYDPKGFAKKIKKQARNYFNKNKKATNIWKEWEKDYLRKKKIGLKIKSVETFYKELKKRFNKK